MPAGESGGCWPGTERGAALPTAGIKKDDIAGRDLDLLQLFEGLQVFAMDWRPGFEPALRRGFARQTRRVKEDGAGDHAVFQGVDIAFRAAASGLDVFHGSTVVALAIDHHV